MSFRKYSTARELEVALEKYVDEIQRDDPIDLVYIPPDVDSLTDEEAIDDESPLTERDLWGGDIAGTYEIHLPENDSSDKETLAMKRMKLGKSREINVSNEQNEEKNDSSDEETLASVGAFNSKTTEGAPQRAKGGIHYTHCPINN
ncbi:hypothetical protein JTB14_022759 [Gonioctena quinquepunctata]|nr:hypothetical protein JTB14_022759 [Gonioctena quinquepunctata]